MQMAVLLMDFAAMPKNTGFTTIFGHPAFISIGCLQFCHANRYLNHDFIRESEDGNLEIDSPKGDGNGILTDERSFCKFRNRFSERRWKPVSLCQVLRILI